MNYIDEIFNRCSIDRIGNFLLYGTEPLEDNTESYYSRSQCAYKNLNEWLEKQIPDIKIQNQQCGYIHDFTYEIENIYFQLGLQAGIMLAMEFNKKQQTEI